MKTNLTPAVDKDRISDMAFVPGNPEMNYLHYEFDVVSEYYPGNA